MPTPKTGDGSPVTLPVLSFLSSYILPKRFLPVHNFFSRKERIAALHKTVQGDLWILTNGAGQGREKTNVDRQRTILLKADKLQGISMIFSYFFVDKSFKMRIIDFCMDTHNDIRMACGEIAKEIAGFSVVVGAKQLRKALNSGKAHRVFLAQNADPAITEPLAQLCRQKKVPYAWVRSMLELGQVCGIEVGAAAAAAVK